MVLVNKNSSVGITEDIITNIMHLGASEYHLEILVRKYEDQIKYWYKQGQEDQTDSIQDILASALNDTEFIIEEKPDNIK